MRWASPIATRFSRWAISSSTSRAAMRCRQSSNCGGGALWLTATRAQAVSSNATALSGNCRAGIYRCDSFTAALTASSSSSTRWCFSSGDTVLRSISNALSSSGSWICTVWKRRVSAGSFSIYFLYSAQVVAPMVRNCPRASAGFSRFAASPVPCWPPAPIRVWISSINSTIGVGLDCTSLINA